MNTNQQEVNVNRLILAKNLTDLDWLSFSRLIKSIENSYGVSIYHATPYERKTISDFSIGRLEICPHTRSDLRGLRNFLENKYNIAIYRMELSVDHKSHLAVGGLKHDTEEQRRLKQFIEQQEPSGEFNQGGT
jgi:hypothetical protein